MKTAGIFFSKLLQNKDKNGIMNVPNKTEYLHSYKYVYFYFLIKMQMLSFARTYGFAKRFCLATIRSYAFFVRITSVVRTFLISRRKEKK